MTYLFFADDYLLFIKAALAECQKIKEILGWYEVLRVPTVQQYEKYLGLLLMLVELKKSALLKSRKEWSVENSTRRNRDQSNG